jgi:hypothetical protein
VTIVDSASGGSGSVREDSRSAKGAVYRIAPDGLWDRLWESKDEAPYDVMPDANGRLVVATGNGGKIFRLDGEPLRSTLIARAAAQQVTALQANGSGPLYFTTANPGKVYRLNADLADRGTFESQVYDAGTVSTWGSIRWRTQPEGGRIEISSRSGNSATPDDTWSAWSSRYGSADGSPIASPNARYLQWRAIFTRGGQQAALSSVSAAYLQRNIRPQVRSITIHPPGIVFQKPYSKADPDLAGFDNQSTPDRRRAAANTSSGSSASLSAAATKRGCSPSPGRPTTRTATICPTTSSTVARAACDMEALRRTMTESILVWDTTTVANGTYFVRVVASDAPSNGASGADWRPRQLGVRRRQHRAGDYCPERARSGRRDPRHAGRHRRSVSGAEGRMVARRTGLAGDLSAGRHRGLAPERYELSVPGTIGPRGVIVRATDAMNNVATTEVALPR